MCKTESMNCNSDELNWPQNLDKLDSTLWNDKCDYIEMEGCSNLNPNNYNLLVLQLNIRSLLAHQQELRQLLCELEKRNSRIDVLLLCETFLSKNTINMVNIPGYTHIGNYRKEASLSYSRMEFLTEEEMTSTYF